MKNDVSIDKNKSKIKSKIFFQKCNYNYIFFLCYMIFFFLNTYIGFDNYPDKFESISSYIKKENLLLILQLMHLYTSTLSNLLAVIPYFIRKRLLAKNENNIEIIKAIDKKETNDEIDLIYNDIHYIESEKKKKKFKILCILVGVLDFLQKFPFVLFNLIFREKEFMIYSFSCIAPFAIAIQFVCSYYILKIHFYKLQYFSLFLNIGIFIIILICDIINATKNKLDANTFYIYALNIIFLSIELSYGKILILEGFLSVYLLMIIKSSILIVLVIIFSLIFLIFDKDKEIFKGVGLLFSKFIFLTIANILSHFLEDLFLWLIIDRFSPNYNPFAIIFQEVSYGILDAVSGVKYSLEVWDICLRIILYVFSTIGVIIHNEIVVINICNLGSDTKYFLDMKFQYEELYAQTDNPEILKRFETFEEMEDINEDNENPINDEMNNSSTN